MYLCQPLFCACVCMHYIAVCCFALASRRLADLVSDLVSVMWLWVTWPPLWVTWPPLCANSAREFMFTPQVRRCWVSKDWQCCELWREVKLGAHAVWAVSDMTDNDRESTYCTVCHTVTLPRTVRQWYVHHSQCQFGLLRQLTPAVTDCPSPVLRCQQSIPSVPPATPCVNLLTACCSC